MNGKTIIAIFLVVIPYVSALEASTEESCLPPTGLTSTTSNENLQFLIFGEIHGSVEAPALFAESVCSMVTSGKKVLVGLEFPESSSPAFQKFLTSSGDAEDVEKLLKDSDWNQQASQAPDGRTSQAMLDLVKRLRVLRASGHELSVAPFMRPGPGQSESQTPYEKGLAGSLMEAETTGSYDLVMVLVGMLHASKAVVTFDKPIEPMAMHLPQSETVTLNMVSEGGTTWSCGPECGVHPLSASATNEIAGIVLGKEIAKGYDGVFNIGVASASMPVAGSP